MPSKRQVININLYNEYKKETHGLKKSHASRNIILTRGALRRVRVEIWIKNRRVLGGGTIAPEIVQPRTSRYADIPDDGRKSENSNEEGPC